MYCRGCLYNLRGLREARCPECGRGFVPNDPATFSKYPFGRLRTWAEQALCAVDSLLLRAANVRLEELPERLYCRRCQCAVSDGASTYCAQCGAAFDRDDPVSCSRFPFPSYSIRCALVMRTFDRWWVWAGFTLMFVILAITAEQLWARWYFGAFALLEAWLMFLCIRKRHKPSPIVEAVWAADETRETGAS